MKLAKTEFGVPDIDGALERNSRSRELSGRDRPRSRCVVTDDFIAALAWHTRRLLEPLDRHGADELDAALRDYLARNAISAGSVAHVLDQRRLAPTLPVVLPELDVEPHNLADYDALGRARGTRRWPGLRPRPSTSCSARA